MKAELFAKKFSDSKIIPQRLKPHSFYALYGTAEAVPFPKI